MKITAPRDRKVRVEIYEPRQKPEQSEVIIDTFDMEPGEEREVEIRSATAGYRTVPFHEATVAPRLFGKAPSEPEKPDFAGAEKRADGSAEEMRAGEQRVKEHKRREKEIAENESKPQGERAAPLPPPAPVPPTKVAGVEGQNKDSKATVSDASKTEMTPKAM